MDPAGTTQPPTSVQLSDREVRVLGVLIEKSLTQTSGYPMTLNMITLGANQKQNRDPVVDYAEGDVSSALRTLANKGLVVQAEPAPGARAVRFAHKVLDRFRWDRREQAVMAELMLRGRQTAGELRSRASRMVPLTDVPAVMVVLEGLRNASPPIVEELRREPGRSANRFRHRLSISAASGSAAPAEAQPASAPVTPSAERTPSDAMTSVEHPAAVSELFTRVARLEAELAELRGRHEELIRRLPVVLSDVEQGAGHELSTDTGYATSDQQSAG